MGKFGGQAYFELPIETKSMILTPNVPLITGAKGSKSKSNSFNKKETDGLDFSDNGLFGENINYNSQVSSYRSRERQLKTQMYNDILNGNGQLTPDKEQFYSSQITALQDERIRLMGINANLKSRKEMGNATKKRIKNPNAYLDDGFGNLMTVGKFQETYGENYFQGQDPNRIIRQGELGDIIDESHKVNNNLLNYMPADVSAFDNQVENIFKNVGSQSTGISKKAALISDVVNGMDVNKAIKKNGLESLVTGKDNEAELEQALLDFKNRLRSDPEYKRAYNYKFNTWRESIKDQKDYKDKSEDELNNAFWKENIISKMNKKREITQNISANGLGLGNSNNNNGVYEPMRFALQNHNFKGAPIRIRIPNIKFSVLSSLDNAKLANAITSGGGLDKFTKNMDPENKAKFESYVAKANNKIQEINNRGALTDAGIAEVNAIVENVRMQYARFAPKMTQQQQEEIIKNSNNTETIPSHIKGAIDVIKNNPWSYVFDGNENLALDVYNVKNVAGKIGFKASNVDGFIYGWSGLVQQQYTAKVTHITDPVKENFYAFSRDTKLGDLKTTHVSLGLGSKFKEAYELGLENAKIVNLENYVQDYYSGEVKINQGGKIVSKPIYTDAIIATVALTDDDYERYKKNTVSWGFEKDGTINDKAVEISDLIDNNMLPEGTVVTSKRHIDSQNEISPTENIHYVKVMIEDSKDISNLDYRSLVDETKNKTKAMSFENNNDGVTGPSAWE